MATKRKSERLAAVAAENGKPTTDVVVPPAAKKTKQAAAKKKKKETTVEEDGMKDAKVAKTKAKPAGKRTIPEEKKKVVVAEIEEPSSGPDPSDESAESDNASSKETSSNSKTIVVEYCKQCQQFKKRAFMVKEGLEKAFPNIKLLLNPDKPRRGCFEVRVEGGEVYISLLDMKRPFQKMKDLDMEKVVADIVKKVGKL